MNDSLAEAIAVMINPYPGCKSFTLFVTSGFIIICSVGLSAWQLVYRQ
jgi:hypothetical protein